MPFAVLFQKIDPWLGAIIIGAEVMCDGANINGACLPDVDGEVVGTCQGVGAKIYGADPGGTRVRGVGAIDLGADPWRRLRTCQGVGAIDLGVDPLYTELATFLLHSFSSTPPPPRFLHALRAPPPCLAPRRPVPRTPPSSRAPRRAAPIARAPSPSAPCPAVPQPRRHSRRVVP
jgi:hypothetical protein